MQRFIVVDLSNFYFDTAKDRLYTGYAYFGNQPQLIPCVEDFSKWKIGNEV